MQYYGLKSIVASKKKSIEVMSRSDSFFRKTNPVSPYIEPTFTKEECQTEKPSILLISAVGASGKTTTAHALAYDTGLPILDLAKHKPVGDNTLTGILTASYPIQHIGQVLEGFRQGTHGVIIDGIDEGRSKTTEQGFEAFLDDLIERSRGATSTSIVIFGRSQVLIGVWVYLEEKKADVGLVKIEPFDLEKAKGYIDAYVTMNNLTQQSMYEQARDNVLEKLGAAFTSSTREDDAFLSFIGYPPVLDAIATLLRTEVNYHRISSELSDVTNGSLEIDLLIRIANYLLDRERTAKAMPNFINQIADQADEQLATRLRNSLYGKEEQCARVLSLALSQSFPRQMIMDKALNEQYENALEPWCPEHPFLEDRHVRNAVFEALAVTHCVLSDVEDYQELAYNYMLSKQPTYHLLYIMAALVSDKEISARFFNMLIQSCSEFIDLHGTIEIGVNGVSWEDLDVADTTAVQLELKIAFPDNGPEREFHFNGKVNKVSKVTLGPFLFNTSVTLPCHVELRGAPAIECTGTCRIAAASLHIDAQDLVVRGMNQANEDDTINEPGLFLDAKEVQGCVNSISLKGGMLEIGCVDHKLVYPLAEYVKKHEKMSVAIDFDEKYRRLRRIFMEFASHSKGGLAKYRDKIEHDRVLRGECGRKVLDQLLIEGVFNYDSKFYYLNSENFSKILGITWQELRQHKLTPLTEAFLNRVS